MFNAFKHLDRQNNRGMTLVELMIVVAIVGILASIGGVAFLRQVKRAKISKMEAHTQNLASGQEQLRSNHGVYLPTPPPASTAMLEVTRDSDPATKRKLGNLLNFKLDDLDPGMKIYLVTGEANMNCNQGPTGACGSVGIPTSNWYMVAVEMDMDGKGAPNTIVVRSSNNKNVNILNEGQ